MLQYRIQHASGCVLEQEAVLKPVVSYHTRLTPCSTDFYFSCCPLQKLLNAFLAVTPTCCEFICSAGSKGLVSPNVKWCKCVSPLSCAWRSGGPQWGVTTGSGQRWWVGDRDAGDAPLSHRLNVSWSTGSRLGNFQLQLISDYRNDYSEGVMLCVFISLF